MKWALGIILVAGLIGGLFGLKHFIAQKNASKGLSYISAPSASDSDQTVVAVPDSNSERTLALPATPTEKLPETVFPFLTNFYTAYQNKDRARLETFFTSDTTEEDGKLHTQIFKTSTTLSAPPVSFLVKDQMQSQVGWRLTIEETLADSTQRNRQLEIQPVDIASGVGTWLISWYTENNYPGKYAAFLVK